MNPTSTPECASLNGSELRELLLHYRRENWRGIQDPQWQERIVTDILQDDGEAVLNVVADFWQLPSSGGVLTLDRE